MPEIIPVQGKDLPVEVTIDLRPTPEEVEQLNAVFKVARHNAQTDKNIIADTRDLHWRDNALCAQSNPELFFPEKGGSTRPAKKICKACDVRAECLEDALSRDEHFGVAGGLSVRERWRLKKQRSTASPNTL